MGFKSSNRKLFVVLCLICAALMVLALTGYTCDEEDSLEVQDIEEESLNTEKIDYDKVNEVMNTGDNVMHDALTEFHDWLETANDLIKSFESKYNDGTLWDEHLRIMQEGAEVTRESLIESLTLTKGLLNQALACNIYGENLVSEGNEVYDEDYWRYFSRLRWMNSAYSTICMKTILFIEYTYTLLGNPDFCSQRGPEEWNAKYQDYMRDMVRLNEAIAYRMSRVEEARQEINNEDTSE